MIREELVTKCRYFRGEPECPPIIEKNGMSLIWYYEKCWVESAELGDEKGKNTQEYMNSGLAGFKSEDCIPLSLKALLFNRYCHWTGGYSLESDTGDFKEWYLRHYPDDAGTN